MRRLNLWRACALLLAGLLGSTSGSGLLAAQSPRGIFRTGVDLVHLHVVATDAKGRRITGLDKDAFVVFEDRAPQEVAFFAAENVPLDLVVLLDTSASMTPHMTQVQDAAVGFVRSLRRGDRASVVEFNDVVRVRADFTADVTALETAIRGAVPRGNTVLHTAAYVALRSFGRNDPEHAEVRRQAVVVLSDGADTGSSVTFEDVLELAQQSGVSVYTVSLTAEAVGLPSPKGTPQRREADYQMRALARETGARAFFPSHIGELTGVYGEILDELSQQYTLGYTSSNPRRDGAFRRVQVQIVTPAGVQARTRSGYFAPRETPLALREWR